jgi:exosortase
MKNIAGRSENLSPKGRKKKAPRQESVATAAAANHSPEVPIVGPPVSRNEAVLRMAIGVVLLAIGMWAYFPTLTEMVTAWEREPDYSHGFLVAPMAGIFLWLKRSSFPGFGKSSWLLGVSLVLASVAVRLFAGAFFFEAIDGWSMVLWLAGCVAVLFGAEVLRWAGPSIAFLIFMVPLPFRMEGMLSLPLQKVATKISCWGLQLLGQPAIAEGNTILLGDQHLEVAQACSGLRLFVSILALAFAYLMLVRRTWWEKLLLLASVIPIAIIANSTRIIVTGLLYQFVSSETAKHFSHDFAGWAMIPLAALFFWLVLWYLGKLFHEQLQMDIGSLVRRSDVQAANTQLS